MPPQNPNTEQKPDAGGVYKQVSDADPLAQQTSAQPGNFDFMLKDKPQAKKRLGLPGGMGKPAKLLVGAVGILLLVIIAASFLGGGKTNSEQVVDLMAQNQEIVRVSTAESTQLKDQNVLNLAATTEVTLASQQSDLSVYLAKAKVKVSQKQLAARTNPATDAQLQTAAQNSNLDEAYVLYLKGALQTYQNSMQTVFGATKSESLKLALQSAYTSVATLLDSPQFATKS